MINFETKDNWSLSIVSLKLVKFKDEILKYGVKSINFLRLQSKDVVDIEIKETLREIISEFKKSQRKL